MFPTLGPGDRLGVCLGAVPRLGELVAIEHQGEGFVKRWGGELTGKIALGCDNPSYPSYFARAADLRVIGVVVWIARQAADGRWEFRVPGRGGRLPCFSLREGAAIPAAEQGC